MVQGYSNLCNTVYNCFIEKDSYSSELKIPIWWLKGLEIVVHGADVYDEVRYIAFGDSPEELLVWAQINGFDIAKDFKP